MSEYDAKMREKWGLTTLSQGGHHLSQKKHSRDAAWTEWSVTIFRPW
jgi:hypothetical protein